MILVKSTRKSTHALNIASLGLATTLDSKFELLEFVVGKKFLPKSDGTTTYVVDGKVKMENTYEEYGFHTHGQMLETVSGGSRIVRLSVEITQGHYDYVEYDVMYSSGQPTLSRRKLFSK